MVTKKDREYHALSVSDTLSALWEYDVESMILSAHADTLSVRLSMQHRTLRCTLRVSACAESIILSVSFSQHALRVSIMLRV
jgi:hypothetical protein